MLISDSETGCCPPFDPAPWDRKVITWKNRLFLHDRVLCLFHFPLNFGQTIVRDISLIAQQGVLPKRQIMLTDENSPWISHVYLEVTKPIENAPIVRLAGTYLTVVGEGSFSNIKTWLQDMDMFAASQKKTIKKIYYYFRLS